MKNKFNLVFFLSALLIEVFFIQFIILNSDGNIPLYMFVYFETFLLFILSFYFIKKEKISFLLPGTLTSIFSSVTGIKKNLSVPLFIILTGVLFRLTLFPSGLTTSPDAYRYLWEGKVIVNGFNPYLYEPASAELDKLHSEDLPSKIVYKEKKALYPPAAQFLFASAYLISGENFWGLKLLYLLAEILSMIFILKLLYLKNKDLNYVILYAWLPLPVMEYFINAHYDAAGITFLIIFIYLVERGKYYQSAFIFSIAFLMKFLPVLLLPLLLKKIGLKKTALFGLIVLLVTLLFYLPFISAGSDLFSFLLLQLEKWEFNASIYYFIKIFTGGLTARIICLIILAAVIIIISIRYEDFTKGGYGILIGFILLTTTVYPWYLGWLAVINPVSLFYSVSGLFFTINFSNFTPLSPRWVEYTPVLLMEYVPFAILLVYDLRKRWLKNSSDIPGKS